MAKRPDIQSARARDVGQGAEAIFGGSGAAPTPLRRRPGRPAREGGAWDELHSRVTYHLPRDLQEAVGETAAASGRSKSQVVTDAIRQHLKIKP